VLIKKSTVLKATKVLFESQGLFEQLVVQILKFIAFRC